MTLITPDHPIFHIFLCIDFHFISAFAAYCEFRALTVTLLLLLLFLTSSFIERQRGNGRVRGSEGGPLAKKGWEPLRDNGTVNPWNIRQHSIHSCDLTWPLPSKQPLTLSPVDYVIWYSCVIASQWNVVTDDMYGRALFCLLFADAVYILPVTATCGR